jgi:hypothetical protein
MLGGRRVSARFRGNAYSERFLGLFCRWDAIYGAAIRACNFSTSIPRKTWGIRNHNGL